MKNGCRVKWEYTHWLNASSKIRRVKRGVYYGCVKHTKRYKGSDQLAVVRFDGNKRSSRVPWIELEEE